MSIDKLVRKYTKAMKSDEKRKTSGYTITAEVVRVVGDIAYLHFPDGVDETPASMGVSCKKGDKVNVTVSNRLATVVGNLTAPPTNDTKGVHAIREELSEITRDLEDGSYDGEDGAGVVKVELVYCVSDSDEPDEDGEPYMITDDWQSNIPTIDDVPIDEIEEDIDQDLFEDILDEGEYDVGILTTNVKSVTVNGSAFTDFTTKVSDGTTIIVFDKTALPSTLTSITIVYLDEYEPLYYIWMRTLTYTTDMDEEDDPEEGVPVIYGTLTADGSQQFLVRTIIREEKEFSLASATVIPSGGDYEDIQESPWTTNIPTYTEGSYYWSRTKYYYSDGTVSYSPPFYDFSAQIAYEVSQAESSQDNHFWHDTSGAYIGHVEWNKNSGSVLRAVSEGILLTYNGDTMASFTQSGFGLYGTVGNQRANLVSYSNGGISFNNNVDFYIGNNSSYIKWDSVQDKIVIVADTLLFGANATDLETELASMQDDIDDAASDASTAKTTANSASTNASSAYSQAVAAQSAASDAATKATSYLKSTSSGLQIVDTKNTSNYSLIHANGMDVYYGGYSVASFGASARVGYASGSNLYFENNKINFKSGSTVYGDIRYYYSSGGYQFLINSDDYGIFIDAGTNLTLNTPGDGTTKICIDDTVIMNTNYVSTDSGKARYRILFPCASAYPLPTGSTNVGVNSNGALGAYSSSKRYKEDISYDIESEFNPEKLYNIPVATFRYKEEYRDYGAYDCDKKTIGLIAEDVHDNYYVGALHDTDGTVRDWDFRTIIPAMLKLIQDQHAEIETIKAQLN